MHPPHLDSDPWLSRPALELVVALERREISAEELTRRVLERIDRLNPRLQAFVRTMPLQALDSAAHMRWHRTRRLGGARALSGPGVVFTEPSRSSTDTAREAP